MRLTSVHFTVRRVRADEGPKLKAVRLAALLESPRAFGSTYGAEVDQPADHWASRAWLGASGGRSVTQRRAGIAAELVKAILSWARETDATTVDLWVTRGNDAAARLYEAAGFWATGEHQPLPSDSCKDELRMRRVLG